MSLRTKFFAMTYDRSMVKVDAAGMAAQRRRLIAPLRGRVLEIGSGTGSNLGYYDEGVSSLTLSEPDVSMFRRLERRVAKERPQATALRAPAEDLPFEDGTFDAVVSLLVLCGVDDQPRSLREIRRVLRPGGRLVFFEHVLADDAKLAKTQRKMNGLNRFKVGCECIRPTLESIRSAGFDVEEVSKTSLDKVPKFVRPAIAGRAIAPSSMGASAASSGTLA
jgi:ubiquinone/menaquinone biosynthesis C-methylase UbiE